MSFFTALDSWGKDVKPKMSHEDKLRSWIKWAARVTVPGDQEATQEFTTKVEMEVFGVESV